MRRDTVVPNLLAAGLDSQLAEKASDANSTLTKRRQTRAHVVNVRIGPQEVYPIVSKLKHLPRLIKL